MDEPSSYWIGLEPLFLTLRMFGLLPYKVLQNKEASLGMSVLAGLWSVVSIFTQVTAFWFALGEVPNNVNDDLLEMFVRMIALTLTCHFALCWWNTEKVLQYIDSWHIYEVRYEYVTGNRLRNNVNPSYIYWVLVFTIAAITSSVAIEQVLNKGLWHYCFVLAYFFALLQSTLITMLWISNCAFITNVSKKIRRFLKHIVATEESAELVEGARALWLALRGQGASLCASTGPALSLALLVHCACALLGACALLRGDVHLAPTVAWSAATLAACCRTTHGLQEEMGINFLLDIAHLRLLSVKDDTRNQVDLLFSNVSHYPVDLTLCGVILLTRSFLFGVVVATVLISALNLM